MSKYLQLLEDIAKTREVALRCGYRLHALQGIETSALSELVPVDSPRPTTSAVGTTQLQKPKRVPASAVQAHPTAPSKAMSAGRASVRITEGGKKLVDFRLPVPASGPATVNDSDDESNAGETNTNSITNALPNKSAPQSIFTQRSPTGVRGMVDGTDFDNQGDTESIRKDSAWYQGMVAYGKQVGASVVLAKVARLQRRAAEFAASTKVYDEQLQRMKPQEQDFTIFDKSSKFMNNQHRETLEGIELAPVGHPLHIYRSHNPSVIPLSNILNQLLCVHLPIVLASLGLAPTTIAPADLDLPLLGFWPSLSGPLPPDAVQAFARLTVGCSPIGCRYSHLDMYSDEELGITVLNTERLLIAKSNESVMKVTRSSTNTGSKSSRVLIDDRSHHCTQFAMLGAVSLPLTPSVPGGALCTVPSALALAADALSAQDAASVLATLVHASPVIPDPSDTTRIACDGYHGGVENLLSNFLIAMLGPSFESAEWGQAHLAPVSDWAGFKPGDEAASLLFLGSFLRICRHFAHLEGENDKENESVTDELQGPVSLACAIRAVSAVFGARSSAEDILKRCAQLNVSNHISRGATNASKHSHEPNDSALQELIAAINVTLSMVGLGVTGTVPDPAPSGDAVLLPLPLPVGPAPSGPFLRGTHGGTMHVQAVLADLASVPTVSFNNTIGANSRIQPIIASLDEHASELGQRRALFYQMQEFDVKRDGVLLPPPDASRLRAADQASAPVPLSRFHNADGHLRYYLEVVYPEKCEQSMRSMWERTRAARKCLGYDDEKFERKLQRRETKRAEAAQQKLLEERVARNQRLAQQGSSWFRGHRAVDASPLSSGFACESKTTVTNDKFSEDDYDSSDDETCLGVNASRAEAHSGDGELANALHETLTLYELQQRQQLQSNRNTKINGKKTPDDSPVSLPPLFPVRRFSAGDALPSDMWPSALSSTDQYLTCFCVDPVELALRLLPWHWRQRRRVCIWVRLNELWLTCDPHGAGVIGRGRWIELLSTMTAELGLPRIDIRDAELRWLRAVDGGVDSSDGGMTFTAFAKELTQLVAEGTLNRL